MKTSTKILTGFFLIVFLIPVFMLMAFKSKIRKGQFSIVKREWGFEDGNWKSGTFSSNKIIKLAGLPGNNLKVHIDYDTAGRYSYANGSGDSVQVYTVADTVIVKYVNPRATNDDDFRSDLHVYLSLPSAGTLIVDNTELTVNSMDSSGIKNMNVEIMGTGSLNIGNTQEHDYRPDNEKPLPVKLNQLTVRSDGGSVFLGNNVNVRQLNLQANGASTITIDKSAFIDIIQGSLSDSASVKASWKYLKRFTELSKQ